MVFEPGIQVNPVENAAPSETDVRHIELGQESDSDAQVHGGLFLGQASNRGQRQAVVFHDSSYSPREARR
jgi:hypothetical protein